MKKEREKRSNNLMKLNILKKRVGKALRP